MPLASYPRTHLGRRRPRPGAKLQHKPHRELPSDSIRPNYVLGPGDQFLIRAPQAEEINDKPFRIDSEGFVNLPIIGRVKAGGLTPAGTGSRDCEASPRVYSGEPQVIIAITQFRGPEPVFFVGDFKAPGIYNLQGRRTLVEMLASIGGLQPNASRHIKVTRKSRTRERFHFLTLLKIPKRRSAPSEISLGSLRENVNPAEDILLEPYDVISVERAELLYITGEVGQDRWHRT